MGSGHGWFSHSLCFFLLCEGKQWWQGTISECNIYSGIAIQIDNVVCLFSPSSIHFLLLRKGVSDSLSGHIFSCLQFYINSSDLINGRRHSRSLSNLPLEMRYITSKWMHILTNDHVKLWIYYTFLLYLVSSEMLVAGTSFPFVTAMSLTLFSSNRLNHGSQNNAIAAIIIPLPMT